MSIQLPLPGVAWPINMSRRDPVAALEAIARDKADATYAIELLLGQLADKHGIRQAEIDKAIAGYVGDLLSDVFFDLEDELERERDEASDFR